MPKSLTKISKDNKIHFKEAALLMRFHSLNPNDRS